MRTVLIALWFIGCIAFHIYYIVNWGVDDLVTWGAEGFLFLQLRLFFFYFVIMGFLSFDYFREVSNAGYREIIEVTGHSFRTDCMSIVIMLPIVLLSAMITFAFSIYYFYIPSTLTRQTALYSLKVSGLYIGLGGMMAIFLGWFLARRMNKLIGYVLLLLFCICISTPMVQNIKLLFWYRDSLLQKLLRVFYFLPELEIPNDGTVMSYGGNLYPIQFSQLHRILFWILLLGAGIVSCYSFRVKKGILTVLFCAAIGSMWFVVQPTNAWCDTSCFDVTDSGGYILNYYENEENTDIYCEETAGGYQINHYRMQITPGWEMRVRAELHFEGKQKNHYDMTLYHLYKIDSITDLSGKTLSYSRNADYLTIHSETESLQGIIITYHGGNSCFYCNRNDIFLPAWFPYYPIAGFHHVYDRDKNEFADNHLKQTAEFDVTFLSDQDIYSDLPETEKNHFAGSATGAMFLSGFFESKTLENGITCVYYYLDPSYDPELAENRECIDRIAKCMTDSGIWKNTLKKKIFLTPNIHGHDVFYMTEDSIANSGSCQSLMKRYEHLYNVEAFESFFMEPFGEKAWADLKGE